jgi:hypothetical protein
MLFGSILTAALMLQFRGSVVTSDAGLLCRIALAERIRSGQDCVELTGKDRSMTNMN